MVGYSKELKTPSLYTIIKQSKNEFKCKDKIIKGYFNNSKLNENILNIILSYSDISRNCYFITFKPLKPKLYENNKKLLNKKYIDINKINFSKIANCSPSYYNEGLYYKYYKL